MLIHHSRYDIFSISSWRNSYVFKHAMQHDRLKNQAMQTKIDRRRFVPKSSSPRDPQQHIWSLRQIIPTKAAMTIRLSMRSQFPLISLPPLYPKAQQRWEIRLESNTFYHQMVSKATMACSVKRLCCLVKVCKQMTWFQ